MLFFTIELLASAVIVLAWLTPEEKESMTESQKIDDLFVLANCKSGTSAMLSSDVNCPVVHDSTQ